MAGLGEVAREEERGCCGWLGEGVVGRCGLRDRGLGVWLMDGVGTRY